MILNAPIGKPANNLFLFMVFTMGLSGILSAAFVLADANQPECYALLWLLPAFFVLDCALIYPMRKLLFTRVSVTMICGLYWVRMVATPVIMVLGNYAVVPENTSWQAYLDQAIILECYESLVVFLVLYGFSRLLACENRIPAGYREGGRIRYSVPFAIVFAAICLFFFGMMAMYPDLIRYKFITIFGAPDGWTIQELEQRTLSGEGSGPLGVLVTMWSYLVYMMQILLPPVLLTWILNHRKRLREGGCLLLLLVLAGVVLVIATENRAISVISSFCLLLTFLAFATKRQSKSISILLVTVILAAALGLWYKTVSSSGLSSDLTSLERLSAMMTSYFSGPQNVAAAVEAAGTLQGADPMLLLGDVNISIPFFSAIVRRFVDLDVLPTNLIFNRTLYGAFDLVSTDQIVPEIGHGCMNFGYLLAPLGPALIVIMAVALERFARKTPYPVYKNLLYLGTIHLALSLVCYNMALGMSFLWYVGMDALIAAPLYLSGKRAVYRECGAGKKPVRLPDPGRRHTPGLSQTPERG